MIITSDTLSTTFKVMLPELGMDSTLYFLHILHRGGATAAYRQGVDVLDIKSHGNWAIEAFWGYITDHFITDSTVAQAVIHAVTSQASETH